MNQVSEIRAAEQPASAFSARNIRGSVIDRLRSSELKTHPSPHIFVEDIFPADFYEAIQAHFPPEDVFQSRNPMRTTNERSILYRKNVNLEREMKSLDDRIRPYWEIMRETLDHPDFVNAIFEKFAEPMRKRYDTDSLDVRIRLELFRDRAGYAIGPHTDVRRKVFTGLFYLPRDHSQKDLGTSLFLPKQNGFTEEKGTQFPFEMFDECVRMPFIPNCMFMFMKTENSFHGRYEIPETPHTRNWMNCSVQLAYRFVD